MKKYLLFLALLLMSGTVNATYSPQAIITDAVSGKTATVNNANELAAILGPDSNVCKETGGNLTSILSALGSPLQAGGTVSVSNFPVTQPVTGTVSVSNFPVTQPVTGTFFQATQPISGAVSVSNFPSNQNVTLTGSSSVSVNNFPSTQNVQVTNFPSVFSVTGSGNFTAVQPTGTNLHTVVDSGAVTVSNFPLTQAVSGAVTANAGSGDFNVVQAHGINLHADIDNFPSSFPISGTVTVSNFPATQPVSGNINSTITEGGNNANVTIANALKVDGSAVTQPVSFGALPLPANASQETGGHLASIDSKFKTDQQNMFNSTSVVVASNQTPIPISGSVTASGTVAVSNFPVTQPVSGTVAVSNFPATQTVTGTVTANIGTTNGLALNSGLTTINSTLGNPFQAGGSIGNTSFVATQSTGTNLHAVVDSGAIIATGSGNFTVVQPTGTNLHEVIDNFPATQPVSGTISVSNFPATQPISGTVTSNIGTTGGLALDSSLSTINTTLGSPFQAGGSIANTTFASTQSGNWSFRAQDGAGNLLTSQVNGAQRALDVGVNVAGVQVDPRSIRALTLSDTVTVVQPTGSNLHTAIDSSALPTGAATSANQTNASQKTQLVDGSGGVVGPIQTLSGTNYFPVVTASSATPGSAVVARSIQIAGSDGTNAQTLSTDSTGKLNLNNISGTITLPTGAATSASQTTTIANQTNGTQKSQQVDGSGNVQPSGDTNARGVHVIPGDGTNLQGYTASSEAKVLVTPLTSSSTVTVVQPTGTNLHEVVDSSALPTGAATSANQTTANTSLASIDGKLNSLGQKAMSASVPVAIASDQSAVPSSQSGTWNINNVSGTISLPTGAATSANQTNASQKTQIVDGSGNVMTTQVNGAQRAADVGINVAGVQVDPRSIRAIVSSTDSILAVPSDGTKATYSAAAIGFVPPAAASDVFTITGSGTKTIRITRVEINGTTTAGAGASINLQLIKRSTADTGGTSSAVTVVPHDSTSAAGTATVLSYTANPTLGTSVGPIRSDRFTFVTVGADAISEDWEFGTRPSQEIVLRGTSQVLAVNLNGATITSPVMDVTVEWTEE